MNTKNFKIKIYSVGGQGIKSMSRRLEESLSHRYDLFFTSLVIYDGIIKGGAVETNIVISDKKNPIPFFDECDICIFTTEVKKAIPSKKTITLKTFSRDDSLDLQKGLENEIFAFFEKKNTKKP
jgi:Pyruvate/2-oxoacid:ferredoxin oxidoreductase gamma subunit